MKTYILGTLKDPAILTVEEITIRRAIVEFGNMLKMGIKSKEVYGEEYAVVDYFNDTESVRYIVQELK